MVANILKRAPPGPTRCEAATGIFHKRPLALWLATCRSLGMFPRGAFVVAVILCLWGNFTLEGFVQAAACNPAQASTTPQPSPHTHHFRRLMLEQDEDAKNDDSSNTTTEAEHIPAHTGSEEQKRRTEFWNLFFATEDFGNFMEKFTGEIPVIYSNQFGEFLLELADRYAKGRVNTTGEIPVIDPAQFTPHSMQNADLYAEVMVNATGEIPVRP
eukprot:GHVT01026110.1.p1 GENE.GHVT01026110.1~~GHVT01026110.1.p1  ORF type:complete len:214 (-),score=19.23 GHVT01026110.1:81-722(-)